MEAAAGTLTQLWVSYNALERLAGADGLPRLRGGKIATHGRDPLHAARFARKRVEDFVAKPLDMRTLVDRVGNVAGRIGLAQLHERIAQVLHRLKMAGIALQFGLEAIRMLGATDEEVAETRERVREFDARRFELQVLNGVAAGRDLLISNANDQAREQGVPQPDDDAAEPSREPV